MQLKDTHGKQLKSKGHGEVLRASKGHNQTIYEKKIYQWLIRMTSKQNIANQKHFLVY